LLLFSSAAGVRAATVPEISQLVGNGHWREAQQEIAADLAKTNLSFQTRQDLLFQRDRMRRISLDFDKTRAQVFAEARAIVPVITEQRFDDWDKEGAIEFLNVDGTRRYFNRAAANLFRINPEAKALKEKVHPGAVSHRLYRLEDIQNVISNYDKFGTPLNSLRTWRIAYTLSVKPGAVPPGEMIRAWLPFPHTGGRQSNIRMISADPARYIFSDSNAALSSVYLERPAAREGPTQFKIAFEYTSDAYYQPIDPDRVQPTPTNDASLAPFLGEEPPNIVFSDEIKKLSHEIVGSEMNPYLKARRLFEWTYKNIPWASAREYSTIECLPKYVLACRHGDCGMKTMTFMTLCRYNGIPARWESGWTTDPVQDMHDWCEIYLAPYGWVPVDVTYGLVDSADEREKWFYLGGIDAGRLVLNTDYAQPLYPAKTFFRSE
ncbi:MAG TPA: transglutaminase domain-containing protein, partial [Verrucomicrobiae bacterium]|nr:transglutaminase domain-containing protein [Verrucomicrobiae bacterium]